MRVCTIIARNYWAHARALAACLAEHHPDVVLKVLVIDGDAETVAAASGERFDVMLPDAIGLDQREFHRMATMYDVLELSTAVKPWLVRTLLKEDGTPVVYLDPDVEIFAPITEAAELAEARGIVLTPHTLEALPNDGYEPTELTILGSGTYNLGFIAVGRDAFGFLDWWADHLRRDGLISKEEGMFVDQRWIDLTPSLFDVHIIRDPGWNVAYWNLAQRPITRFGNRLEAAGRPLRFFHYSGFDPDRPRLSLFQGENPRVRLEDQPVVSELCERYARRLIEAGYRAYSRLVYGFAHTSTGLALDQTARRLYRLELIRAERTGAPEPPNPFEPEAHDDFESWLRDPAGAHGVTRYLRAVHADHPPLQVEFPDLDGPDGRALLWWALTHGVKNGDVLPRLLEMETPGDVRTPPGVNVAGYMRAESGVGEAGRLLVAALDAAGVPRSIVTYENTRSRQQAKVPDEIGSAPHAIDLICVNADQLHHFLEDTGAADGRQRDDGPHRIGVWAWEVDVFPEWMARAADHVDEIWTYSAHAAHAIAAATSTPVHVVPPPILRPDSRPLSRAELGLPDGFVFLFAFDFASVFERKNPLAVIDAFGRAFARMERSDSRDRGGDVHLVIKTVGGASHPHELKRLQSAATTHANVQIRDGYVTREEHQALVAACDAFVSLHRAEGYGLHLAEAMAHGKPVIATGYSGNLEFMDDTNSRLVPFTLVGVPEGSDPYPAAARWAEPDVDAAADLMREIATNATVARTIGERAAADIARLHAPSVRGELIADLLSRIPQPVNHGVIYEAPVHDEPPPPEDVLSLEALFAQVRAGAGLGSPTRFVRVSRRIRRLVSRLTWHTAEHQRRIDLAITHNINHLVAETSDLGEIRKLIEELHTRIREIDARMIKERDYRRDLADELRRLERGDPNAAPGGDRSGGLGR